MDQCKYMYRELKKGDCRFEFWSCVITGIGMDG
jgi:hypothetical protein